MLKEKRKPSPAEGEFLFEIDVEPLEECITAWGGIPLLLRTARSLDVPGLVQRYVQVKERERYVASNCVIFFVTIGGLLSLFSRTRSGPRACCARLLRSPCGTKFSPYV